VKPKFSILIPTRNREDLLRHAVISVLEQTYVNFEIVISDNNSYDFTQEFCLSLCDQRVKYTRLEQDVTVDVNWNNAFLLAQGEYIIQIGDDDYLAPQCLKELVENIDLYSDSDIFIYSQARYFAKDYPMKHFKNSVSYGHYSGTVQVLRTEAILNEAFGFLKRFHSSAICIKRALLRSIGAGVGPYLLPFPDYYAIFGSCLQTDKVIMIDKLLVVVGTTARGCGTKTQGPQRLTSWNEHPLDEINVPPIQGNLFINGFYQSLSQLKSAFPTQTERFSIDMDRYVDLVLAELFLLKRTGDDVSCEYSNLINYLRQQPLNKQLAIRSKIVLRRIWSSMPSSLRGLISRIKNRGARVVHLPPAIDSVRDCYSKLTERGLIPYDQLS